MTIDVVDKAVYGSSGTQACIGVEVGQVSDVVLMCGDPFRVQLIADQLENPVEIAHRREYRSVNGHYKGRLITAISHGVGCPSTAIAVEELFRAGARLFIRVGSSAALQPGIAMGDLIVSEGLFGNEGTTAAFVPAGTGRTGPSLHEHALRSRRRMGEEKGFVVHSGINVTDDAYYGETPEWIRRFSSSRYHQCRDGESSAIFVIARQHKLQAAMVCSVCQPGLLNSEVALEQTNERLAAGWRHSITAALETVIELGI